MQVIVTQSLYFFSKESRQCVDRSRIKHEFLPCFSKSVVNCFCYQTSESIHSLSSVFYNLLISKQLSNQFGKWMRCKHILWHTRSLCEAKSNDLPTTWGVLEEVGGGGGSTKTSCAYLRVAHIECNIETFFSNPIVYFLSLWTFDRH